MEKLALRLILLCMGTLIVVEVFAQPETRTEDHFFRRRVVNRIDLSEKINRPLTQRSAATYANSQSYQRQGLIAALMHGFREGKYVGYQHDNLKEPLDFTSVTERMNDFDFNGSSGDLEGEEEDEIEDPDDEWEPFLDDPDDLSSVFPNEPSTLSYNDPLEDLGAYETVVQFVEDRIFDKKLGKWIYKIDQIQIIWADPGETLPDKYLVSFRYDDVKDLLDEVLWVNRFNDAEQRTLKEIFELRLFHSYIIDISGSGIASLAEAEYRRQKLVEFEHHLWSY